MIKGVNMAKKKLLYVDHSFHNKTKSAQFLRDILQMKYDVEICDYDPYGTNPESVFESFKGREFDVLVLFQIMPNLDKLKSNVLFKHAAFFPMFDASGDLSDEVWESYRGFNIINFSSTLHKRLLELGMSSFYVQYFPKPFKEFHYGNPRFIYFWQRVTSLNLRLVEKILCHIPISKIHLHKALDPGHVLKKPSAQFSGKIEMSEWYETREDMLADIEQCGLYVAPRPYEGIGMSFLEAMAMGRCVIAPDHPTMNEYIVHGKTGLLYDLYNPHPVAVPCPIREIQQNAYEYICQGYACWEAEKYRILEWLETPVHVTSPCKKKHYLKKQTHRLFCFFPLLTIKDPSFNKRYYDLFGFIRLLKVKRKQKGIKLYLFGFIPIWMLEY